MLYLRYIDHMFIIWKGYYDDHINRQHPTIKFDFVISKETVSFLDKSFI